MESSPSNTPTTTVLWQQVWGLALLQSAVALSWQVYSAGQPVILRKFDLAASLGLLSLVPGFLGLTLDPLMGRVNDRVQQRFGSRLPMINLGAILTSLVFLTVALGMQATFLLSIRWIIPGLMVLWVTTMKVFQNPSVALVKRYATPKDLPQAAALLTLMSGVVGALRPFTRATVAQYGASITFLMGGTVLLVAVLLMRRLTPKTASSAATTPTPPLTRRTMFVLFLVGCGTQLAAGIASIALPSYAQTHLPQFGPEWIAGGVLLVSGLSAWPVGQWIKTYGVERATWIGVLAVLGLTTLASFSVAAWLMILILIGCGVTLAVLFNLGVPFALARAPGEQASFAIGLFFGGGGLAALVIALWRLWVGDLALPITWLMSGGALGLVALALWIERASPPPLP